MSIDSTCSAKKLNLERATNFMRQFRDPDSRELKKLSANQFMEVWSHYDRDGNGYIEGTELDGFLKEFVSSANFTDISPDDLSGENEDNDETRYDVSMTNITEDDSKKMPKIELKSDFEGDLCPTGRVRFTFLCVDFDK